MNRLATYLLPALLLAAPLASRAQGVGIGTTAPDASAALDIVSGSKGVLLPRVSSTANVSGPAAGLIVYQNTAPVGYYYYDGSAWQRLVTGSGTSDFIRNQTSQQTAASFNVDGSGTVGSLAVAGALTGSGSTIGTTVGVGVRADGGLNLGQNTTGNNIYLGYLAGRLNTGSNNQFDGYQSGYNNNGGSDNVFSGYRSGYNNNSGIQNVFTGSQAGYYNTAGKDNVFMGISSGYNTTTGNFNVAVGAFSGPSSVPFVAATGSNNVLVGAYTGVYLTSGGNNVFSGYQSGINTTTGSGNVFSGYQSGQYNSTGSNNTALGYNAGQPGSGGALTNTTALGANASVTQSNSLVLGGTGTNAVSVGIGTTAPGATLDVVGSVRAGTSSTPATVLGNPTGTHNLLAVAYGQLGQLSGNALAVYSTSGNYNATRTGTGTYTITFTTASGLNSYNFDNAPVAVTLYNSNGPGFTTFSGGAGVILIKTYNVSGTATDGIFSFTVFAP